MAGQRLTDKTAITGNLAEGDLFMAVDVSDTTGSSAGTSKKIKSKFVIQTDKVSVASGIFQAMDTSGSPGTFAELLIAPGAGLYCQVLGITAIVDYASGTQSAKVALMFGWDSTDSSNYWSAAAGFMQGLTADMNYSFAGRNSKSAPGGVAGIANRGFYVFSNGNFSSTFSADFYITYQVVTA